MWIEVAYATLRKLQDRENTRFKGPVFDLTPKPGKDYIYSEIPNPFFPLLVTTAVEDETIEKGEVVIKWEDNDIVARNIKGEIIQSEYSNFAVLTKESTRSVLLSRGKWDRRYKLVRLRLIDIEEETRVGAKLLPLKPHFNADVRLPLPIS